MFCLFWINTYHQFRYLHCVFHVCRGKQAKIRQQKKRQHAKTLQYNATLMEEELRHDDAVIPDAPPAMPPLPVTPPPPESVNLPPPPAFNRAVRRLGIGVQQSTESSPQPPWSAPQVLHPPKAGKTGRPWIITTRRRLQHRAKTRPHSAPVSGIRGPHRAAGSGAQIPPAPPPCEEVHTMHRASVY